MPLTLAKQHCSNTNVAHSAAGGEGGGGLGSGGGGEGGGGEGGGGEGAVLKRRTEALEAP